MCVRVCSNGSCWWYLIIVVDLLHFKSRTFLVSVIFPCYTIWSYRSINDYLFVIFWLAIYFMLSYYILQSACLNVLLSLKCNLWLFGELETCHITFWEGGGESRNMYWLIDKWSPLRSSPGITHSLHLFAFPRFL